MMKTFEQASSYPPPKSVVAGVWAPDGYLYYSLLPRASPSAVAEAVHSALRGEGLYVARVLLRSRLGLHWPDDAACSLANTHDLRDFLSQRPPADALLFCGPKTDATLDAISIESAKLLRKFPRLSLMRFDPIENTLPRDLQRAWDAYPYSSVLFVTRDRRVFQYVPQDVPVTTLALLEFVERHAVAGAYSARCDGITAQQLGDFVRDRGRERLVLLYNASDVKRAAGVLAEWAKVSDSLHTTLVSCFQHDVSATAVALPDSMQPQVLPAIYLVSPLYEKPQLFIGNKKRDDIIYWTSRKALEMYPIPDEMFPRILRKFKD